METQQQKKKSLNQYTILKTLGIGCTAKVKLGIDTSSDKKVAIKIMNADLELDALEYINNEIDALDKVNHLNIIKLIEHNVGQYKKPGKRPKTVNFAVFEFAELGDLFDVVMGSGSFEEPLARYYAK